MARTAVTITDIVPNGGVAAPAGTTVDPTNGHSIDAGGVDSRLLIVVNNTAVSTKVVTVKAGVAPQAGLASLGDITFTCPASGISYLGPYESARIAQAGGLINVDLAAGITGTIAVLRTPRTV